jgi:adenosylhomocysteine nucleosidase
MEPQSEYPRSRRVGVVTGLASEAGVVSAMLVDASLEVEVLCAGASTSRAATLAERLASQGCEALLSFGIAGALAPDLGSGDLILAHGVRSPRGEDYPTDPAWRAGLAAALQEAELLFREGALLGSGAVLAASADKAKAFAETGCQAVDMESAAVAAVAADLGLPFLAVRAVADRAHEKLPGFVGKAIDPDGRPVIGEVMKALLRHPSEIGATLRLGRQSELALARLRMLEVAKEALFGRF